MTKLTSAQAYALQVRADRRAAALERASGVIREDNNRVNAMYRVAKVTKTNAKTKAKAAPDKVTPWTTAETNSIIETYLRLSTGGVVNTDEVVEAHTANYPHRSEGAVSYVVSQLRCLDVTNSKEVTLVSSEGLLIAAYEAAPERFPAGAELVEGRLNAVFRAVL